MTKSTFVRCSLAIRLTRERGRLVRTLGPFPAPAASDAGTIESDWSALGAGSDPETAPGLEAIARRLDTPSPSRQALFLSEEGSAAIGDVLFQALFCDEAGFWRALSAAFAPAEPRLDAEAPVRVRVVTADMLLAGLPWRLTRRRGARLTSFGWTFEITHPDAPRPGPPSWWNRTYVFAPGTRPPEDVGPPEGGPAALPALPSVRMPIATRRAPLPPGAIAPRGEARAKILVVAPGPDPERSLHDAAHVDALRAMLASAGADPDDPDVFQLVGTARGLRGALARMRPSVVHCRCPIEARDGIAALLLRGPQGSTARVALDDLAAWLRAAQPLVVHLSGPGEEGAWSLAARDLARAAPLVVLDRAAGHDEGAAATARRWLEAIVAGGGDPVIAIHALRAAPDRHGATATLHTAYERWTAEPARPPPALDLACRRALAGQRGEALQQIARLFDSDTHRVLALVAPTPPRLLGEPGAQPFVDEVDIAGADLGRIRHIAIPFPHLGEGAPLDELARALHEAFDAAPPALLERALHEAAAAASGHARRRGPGLQEAPAPPPVEDGSGGPVSIDAPGERAIVWLDWGTIDPERWPSLTTRHLAAWLDLAAEVIAPRCPPGARVVSSLALPMGRSRLPRLEAWLAARRAALEDTRTALALLPAVQPLARDTVRACLVEASPPCTDDQLDRLADLVLRDTAGDLDATSELLARGQRIGWSALARELQGDAVPDVDDGALW
ncbi:hypothetical protein [Sorangium sp. So ce1099]|uniref:hypothetical protein n=1 Tax=Sorangium sp. So ce1099 TaxID=3133331 RepID=UPI003F606B05